MPEPTPFPTPAEILAQEERLTLPACSYDDCLAIGRTLLDRAGERDLRITIEVWHGTRLISAVEVLEAHVGAPAR